VHCSSRRYKHGVATQLIAQQRRRGSSSARGSTEPRATAATRQGWKL